MPVPGRHITPFPNPKGSLEKDATGPYSGKVGLHSKTGIRCRIPCDRDGRYIMKRAVKWILIIGGGLIALIVIALLVAPMFVDVEQYKPMIEEKVAEATGRSFRLDGDLDLSLFPWAGLSLSELHLGNPPGFEKDDFLYIRSFDVRVKLLPLLSKDVQVKRFILEGVQVALERNQAGKTNWEDLGGKPGKAPAKAPSDAPAAPSGEGLPLEALAVGDFSITGSLLWIDRVGGQRKEISDLSLKLRNVTLDRPIGIEFGARLDGKPIALEGEVGPVGRDPLSGTIPLDIRLAALDDLSLRIQGQLADLGSAKRFDLALEVDPFSPRAVLSALGQPLPMKTADPEVLKHLALALQVKGNPEAVSLTDGRLELDESKLAFSAQAKDFSKPDLAFDLKLDRIDLDRYLPPPEKKPGAAEKAPSKSPADGAAASPDYGPLRKLVLDGSVRIGTLLAKGLTVKDIVVEVVAEDGVIQVDPLGAKLYEGTVSSTASVDVRGKAPKSRLSIQMDGIQAGPLVQDLAAKDIIEGQVQGDIQVSTIGDQPDAIKQTLNGKGQVLFLDGAIIGIDLAGMVRNVKSTFGLAQPTGERPKTDFSELSAPFTIQNGLIRTPGTRLKSPLLRILTTGTANLVDESLDLRVDPKVVATLKGQGDEEKRSGIRVPVLVTGTFSSPTFRPDLKGLIEGGLKEGLPDASSLKKMLKPSGEQPAGKEQPSTKDQVKGLLKGFGLGQ